MKLKNKFFIHVLLIQCCVLFAYEFSHDTNKNNKIPHIVMPIQYPNATRKSNWSFSCNVKTILNNYSYQANYSVITQSASPGLQHYFAYTVMPLMYGATIARYQCVLPGYAFPDGLRHCKNQLFQFTHSDAALISGLTYRLEAYCARIETILFNGKKHAFCESVCRDDQIKLVHVYADFLKEFYASEAPRIFLAQSQASPLMQQLMCKIDWGHYDGREAKSKFKTLQKYQAAALNGNLGKVYKALHEGNSEKAHTIGHEKVTTVVGKKQTVTSVFERYPELHQKVKQAHHADRAKAERVRIAQEATIKHDAVNAQMHYEKQNGQTLFEKHPDLLKDRCNVTTIQFYDPRFFEKLHTVLAEHAARIDPQHLTADQKGILCAGSHLQHYLVDEAISVVDTAISGDLVENMQDAVITLANTSLTLNKEGDVIMASRTLDACWALVDHAHAAARCAYSIIVTHAPFIAKGMADGVCESLHGAAHVVCHPVQAAQEAVKSLAVAGYYLGKVAYSVCAFDAACELWEADPEHFEQKIREHLIDPEAFVAIYEHAKNNISTEDVARVGTKTAVDMMLLHGATKVVSAIAKESWPALISCMRKGEQSAEVALTAENIPVQCGEEIAALMENMENAVKTETIAETITNSRKLVENIVGSFMAELNTEIESLKKVFDCAQSCVPDCVKKGFAEFKNKHIKIPHEHIFGIELKWNDIKNSLSGISGFHHDFMGAIEKSGVLKFMRKGVEKNGCYLADVIVDGSRIRDKTFFPQSWSREKVVNKIYEAYENFIKNGAIVKEERGGKYLINGFTSEGIEVEMYITKKGQIATAYPVVKAGI